MESTSSACLLPRPLQVYCGRYVQEHMVVHQDTAGHKMALSLADLSVWCYLCDSYISNHVSAVSSIAVSAEIIVMSATK